METITAWHNGMAVLVSKFVADSLGIKNGHQISSDQELWKILGANAEYNIAALRAITTTSKN